MGAQEDSLFSDLVLADGLLNLVTQSVDSLNDGQMWAFTIHWLLL